MMLRIAYDAARRVSGKLHSDCVGIYNAGGGEQGTLYRH